MVQFSQKKNSFFSVLSAIHDFAVPKTTKMKAMGVTKVISKRIVDIHIQF